MAFKFQLIRWFYEKDDHLFETSLKFPLIAKPSISMIGKSGVTLAKTKDGLKSSILDAKKFSLSGTALLESFIEGVDIEIIGFVKNKMLEIFAVDRPHSDLGYLDLLVFGY